MPLINGTWLTPEDATKQGLCAECGVPLTPAQRLKHSRAHFLEEIPAIPENAEAIRRKKLIEQGPTGG